MTRRDAKSPHQSLDAHASVSDKRVLMIVENLPVPRDVYVWNQARTLRERGYQVSVICPTGPGCEKRREVLEGIHIYRHNMPLEANTAVGFLIEYGWAFLCQLYLSWRVFFERGFDVIHAANPPDTIVFVGGVFKLFGKHFLFDDHDLGPELAKAKFPGRAALYRVAWVCQWLSFKASTVSISPNESYKRVAVDRGGMDPADVFVVRCGPDLELFRPLDPEPELKSGRPLAVGFLGVMGNQDGVDGFLRTASHVVHDHRRDDVQFILIGDGPEFAAMQALADELGIADQTTFAGWKSGDDMVRALSTIDVGVAADPFNEFNDATTMNKIMEYMAVAKPVVQFDLTEGRVTAGDASLYAEPNDERQLAARIVELLDDPERRTRMGRIGRERVESQWSWAHEAPNLLAAYDRLFSRGG